MITMRTVITHFYNEEYLLPWWLNHHTKIFDYGILIDHGSTDNSVDICRQLAPNWRVVKSRLTEFNAYLTDFEVMGYEYELSGWKIALNITEFIISNPSLKDIEIYLKSKNKIGCLSSCMDMVDLESDKSPIYSISLVNQKPWAVDDNRFRKRWLRSMLGYKSLPRRNRFYHCLPTGMYLPGRHASFHPDSILRMPNLLLLHFGFSPWTENFIKRKTQIAQKISQSDKDRGWGIHHLRNQIQLEKDRKKLHEKPIINLFDHEIVGGILKTNKISDSKKIFLVKVSK